MTQRHDIWQLADTLQMDLRAASAKLVELRAQLANLDLPDQSKTICPTCGVPCKGPNTLAEHIHVSHDGPVPQHWAAIEHRSLEPLSREEWAAAMDAQKRDAA